MAHRSACLVVAFVALVAAGCGGSDEGSPATETETETQVTTEPAGGGATLTGSVGPGFDISLDGTDGLTPGAYTLVVDDMATSHNFHLTGPGVDVTTSVGGEGEESFDITLEAGEYQFVCDPHAGSMNGSFSVG